MVILTPKLQFNYLDNINWNCMNREGSYHLSPYASLAYTSPWHYSRELLTFFKDSLKVLSCFWDVLCISYMYLCILGCCYINTDILYNMYTDIDGVVWKNKNFSIKVHPQFQKESELICSYSNIGRFFFLFIFI